MKMVTHADVELSTLSLGPEGCEPLVLLHGLVSGNMATWYTSIALPLAVSRQVVLYDLRGHGGSSLPAGGFDLDSHARDLMAVLDDRLPGQTPVDIVGHSLGALIALRFALTWPHRVRRLVLVDAPMPAGYWVAPSLLAADSREKLADWIANDPLIASTLRGRRRERMQQRLEALFFQSTLVADVLAMGSEREVDLHAFRHPVLLVYGSHSPCLEAGHRLQAQLPNASLHLLDCGHHVPVEAAGGLRALLDDFLCQPPLLAECG